MKLLVLYLRIHGLRIFEGFFQPHLLDFFYYVITCSERLSIASVMDASRSELAKELPLCLDPTMVEEYTSLSKVLAKFSSIPSISKAWVFKSDNGITFI